MWWNMRCRAFVMTFAMKQVSSLFRIVTFMFCFQMTYVCFGVSIDTFHKSFLPCICYKYVQQGMTFRE